MDEPSMILFYRNLRQWERNTRSTSINVDRGAFPIGYVDDR